MTEIVFWKITATAWLITLLLNLWRKRKDLDDGFIVFHNLIMIPIYVATFVGITLPTTWFIFFYWG
jgi:hypothetical protein